LPFAFCLFLLGCHNCDLVEAELRTRETELRETHAELAHAEAQNEALIRELRAVRQGSAWATSPEQASQIYTLKQVVLGRGTGGYDDDDCPGDEALQVVLEPRDLDGHTIKAPGTLHVEALETSPEGIKTPLSSWDLSPDQLRRTWRSGLLSTGYAVVLPWKSWPSSERVRVIARFTLIDGRVFEADKDVTIRLTPEARRKSLPPADPDGKPAPGPPEPSESLSPPRKIGATKGTASPKWWLPPAADPSTVQSASLWRPKPVPSLADAVQLSRPVPLTKQPGEDFDP
jgi:hypothetical protein